MCFLNRQRFPENVQWFDEIAGKRIVNVVVRIDLQIGYVSNFH